MKRSEHSAHPRPRLPLWLGAALVAVLAAGALVLRLTRPPAPPGVGTSAAPLNILLVTLDTTRADHLGAYGSARARTRHMDRLAAEGVRFDRAFSPAPITLPAHASILTGLYPFDHGVRNNGNFYLADRYDTLATRLRARGYRTGAFVSSFILDRRYGLARGFETYDDRMEGAQPQVLQLEAERRGDRTSLALLAWLDANARDASAPPFFAWLHLYDPHEPYRPPPPFRDAFADSPYDGEIAFDDAIVAAVLDRLGRLGLLDRTLVAIVGDHGESLGDHGEETHSMFVYDPALRVPFILWRPGLLPGGAVVRDPVRLTDVAPTLLELAGAPPLQVKDGRSLVPLIRGKAPGPSPPVYAETLLPQLYMNWAPLRSVRDERWKLIEAPQAELYDVASDPAETHNRYLERPQAAQALRQQLAAMTGGAAGRMSTGTMDRETLEKLAALGYVGAGAEPSSTRAAAQADPKDMIGVFNQLRRANSAVRDRRFGEALPVLREVLAKDPKNAFAQLVLGSAHMGMGDYHAAITEYRRYLSLVPSSAYAHHWLSICAIRLGDQAAALREADAALAIDGRFSDARIMKGGILASRGDYGGAVAELRAAAEADPVKPAIRLDLAKVLAESGRPGEAQAEYEAALRIQPDYGPALTGLGALLAAGGRLDEAEQALRRATEIDAADLQARLNLAVVYSRRGQVRDARAEYERVLASPAATPRMREAARAGLRR
jgi:choline-sulfatase